ncbi:MAG: hypothetical protein N4A74_05170 [Carboxylicivirga sp.]|jgi:hypothetical protein|nr:hypothetical protein [Carboxylicivirga sp.]
MRNSELKKKRDKRMVEKFHQLYDIERKRIDDVLLDLSENYFFLDKDYIYSRIFYCKENSAYYNELLEASSDK